MDTTDRMKEAYDSFPDGPDCYKSAALDQTLRALFQSATNHAQSRIEWYGENAQKKAFSAKSLRRWSLILFATGTIAPITIALLVSISKEFGGNDGGSVLYYAQSLPMAEVGYLLLAIAGALIIFDQFFDASGSWIRFRQSEARLKVLLAEFRFAWAGVMARSGGVVPKSRRWRNSPSCSATS